MVEYFPRSIRSWVQIPVPPKTIIIIWNNFKLSKFAKVQLRVAIYSLLSLMLRTYITIVQLLKPKINTDAMLLTNLQTLFDFCLFSFNFSFFWPRVPPRILGCIRLWCLPVPPLKQVLSLPLSFMLRHWQAADQLFCRLSLNFVFPHDWGFAFWPKMP